MATNVLRFHLDQRAVRGSILVAVVGLLLIPVIVDSDDFPLSTYPMYATARSNDVAFATAWGRGVNGERLELGLGVIGSSDDPLIVAGELRASIRAGAAEDRCQEIARRASSEPSIIWIEVTTERHDVVAHARGEASLIERTVHASCAVSGVSA